MRKFCNGTCQDWKDSWADHPDYQSYNTYKRDERCWGCDRWTLSYRTIFLPRSSHLDRGAIQRALNDIKSGQARSLTAEQEGYNSNTGEYFHETVIYNGGETYTHITENGNRQRIEYKQLETMGNVMGVLFLEVMEDVFGFGIINRALTEAGVPPCVIS